MQPRTCRRCFPAGPHANRHLLVRIHRIIDHRSHSGGGLPGAQSPLCSPRRRAQTHRSGSGHGGGPRRLRGPPLQPSHRKTAPGRRIRRTPGSRAVHPGNAPARKGDCRPTSRVGGKTLRTFAEPAEAIFRDQCTGVAWEIDTARIFALWSLNYLGEIGELRRRWSELMKDAKERGDMYMTGTLGTLMMAIVRLADDNLAAVRTNSVRSPGSGRSQGFHIQHHNRVLASCLISLYRGDNAETWERLEMLRPTYARSLLLRVQTIRVELYRFRARGALAASRVADDPGRLLQEAGANRPQARPRDFPAAAAHALSIRGPDRGGARCVFRGPIALRGGHPRLPRTWHVSLRRRGPAEPRQSARR